MIPPLIIISTKNKSEVQAHKLTGKHTILYMDNTHTVNMDSHFNTKESSEQTWREEG